VTYHPAYLLRTPADKRKAWEDLKLARRTFGELAAAAVR
jgi:uracil-DNA glycosylase